MAIYRGPGGAGDATNDATSQAILAVEAAAEAQASATSAASSASSASTSATNAANSATSASNSASAASDSKTAAQTAETNAETAQAAAEAARDASLNFGDDLSVQATTLAAGSDATVTYDSNDLIIEFGLPRGDNGIIVSNVAPSNTNVLWGDTSDPEQSINLDSSYIDFTQSGTGAIKRTVQTKLRETVSVKDFGAVGDGVTDDTAAINDALSVVSTTAQSVYFPAGTYLYDGGGVLGNGVVIYGDGRNATVIKSALATPTNNYLFNVIGYGSGVHDMAFYANTTQTGGSYVWLSGPESYIENFYMTGDYNGILMTGNVSRILHGRFQDGAAGAIRIRAEGGDNSQLIDDVLMGAQSPQVSSAGIRVRNSSALIISNTSVIQQGNNLLIDPTTVTLSSNTADGGVYSLYVNNCFFDNAGGNAIRIVPTGTGSVVRCRFANCWAGSSASDGVIIDNAGSGTVQGLYFDSCHAVLNGTGGAGSGLTTGGSVSDISINGGVFASNTHGMYFNSGTSNLKVCSATIGRGGGLLANSNNGVVLDNGTSNIVVVGNTISGNGASGVFAGGTSTAYVISDNFITDNGTNLNVNATTNRVVKNNVGVDSPDLVGGNSAITAGNTSVVVTHNLGVAPAAYLINIWPTDNWGTNHCYVDTTTITSTQFTVKSSSVAAGNLYFGWQARINNK